MPQTKAMNITINKPIFGSFCGIRDKIVYEAIKNGEPLIITIPGLGTGVHDPKVWRRKAKVMLKEFLIPGQPMRLFCGNVKIDNRTEEEKEKDFQMSL